MPTFGYTTVITQIDDSTINFAISGALTPIVPVTSTFTNQRTSVVANMVASFPYDPLPNSYDLDSTVAGMGAVFGDSVYRCIGSFTRGGDTYNSDDYFLVTTNIDAGIAAMPTTTPAEIARKAYLVDLRQDIQDEFDAANYTDANLYIGAATSYLDFLTNASVAVTATLSAPNDMDVDISVLAFTYAYWGGWYNALTNTLTSVVYPYTLNFDPNNGATYTVVNPTDYPDGVYENYMSVLGSISATDANLFYGTGYALVTTTIDNQIALFQANYDANITAEAIALADLLQLQTDIATEFAANDYAQTNILIAEAQAILANGLSRGISAALTSDADMSVYFTVPPAMPVGTYTDGSIEITNTLTGVSFTYDGFPTDAADLTQALNSEDLGFGADFPDGVYQIVVTFYVDGLLFTAECYLVVTTDWQCCIDKAAGKKCGKLNTALMQANLTNAVRLVAIYSDVNTANALISEGNRECSGCGCGCS